MVMNSSELNDATNGSTGRSSTSPAPYRPLRMLSPSNIGHMSSTSPSHPQSHPPPPPLIPPSNVTTTTNGVRRLHDSQLKLEHPNDMMNGANENEHKHRYGGHAFDVDGDYQHQNILRHHLDQNQNEISNGTLSDGESSHAGDPLTSPSTPSSAAGNKFRSTIFNTRKERRFIPDSRKDESYWDRRRRNNEAAKR